MEHLAWMDLLDSLDLRVHLDTRDHLDLLAYPDREECPDLVDPKVAEETLAFLDLKEELVKAEIEDHRV